MNVDRIVGSGAVATLAGMGAYYAAHSCDLFKGAYDQCWNQAVNKTTGPLGFMAFEWVARALTTNGREVCPREWNAYKDCMNWNFTGTLAVISLSAAALALITLCSSNRDNSQIHPETRKPRSYLRPAIS